MLGTVPLSFDLALRYEQLMVVNMLSTGDAWMTDA